MSEHLQVRSEMSENLLALHMYSLYKKSVY